VKVWLLFAIPETQSWCVLFLAIFAPYSLLRFMNGAPLSTWRPTGQEGRVECRFRA
jgi:hypothetical protein